MTPRERRVLRWLLWIGAAIAGVGLASAHWIGVVIGGAFVGLLARTVPRGVLAGAAFGLFVWLVFAGTIIVDGAWEPFLATGGFVALSAAIAVALGAFGGLARGLR
ncbi:hypothetical protein AArcSl_1025 [Halalkaliarchaeum desulfuricum]|uniref:Uncharacterized protein n=1 Tax=Halalkaliarchaeum desulfuricum TaxID=2055893 RepID=A0A343THU1_9EURY|nr:hypothetical protein [Halalkaliarchaeum desulfuricum]AUX08663.1 hypothetical protein AArcSl_1025 [Halalkaliarchaeum desulfuricum]